MRSLVLAVALSVTAVLAVAAAMTIETPEPRPAGYVEASSSWARFAEPTIGTTTSTLAEVEIRGIPLTDGTEPTSRTPVATSTTAAPRPAPAPTSTAPATTAAPTPTAPGTTAAPAPTTTAIDPYFDYSYASALVSLANSSRAAQGLGALTWSDTLASTASSAALRMADAGSLSHSNLRPLLGPFSIAGENIGRGYTEASGIHSAWMGSGSHRENILKPAFTQVGIAVWVDANGQPWVSQVFGG